MRRSFFIALGLFLLAPVPILAISSTFDNDLEGWILVDVNAGSAEGELIWRANGGNPGGFVEFVDEGNDGGFISAPEAYLGNWTPFDGSVTFSYDHVIISEGTVENRLPYEVRITGPGGEAQFLGATPSGPAGWIPVEVAVDEQEWTILNGDWPSLMADVTSFRIRIEQTQGHVDVSGIDNIEFPIPAAVDDRWTTPGRFHVVQSTPNPFSLDTAIAFANNSTRGIALEVFDVRGRLVAKRRYSSAGEGSGTVVFDGRDDRGFRLSAGHYIVRLTSGDSSATCKVTAVR